MTANPEIDPNSIVAQIISALENQPGVRPLPLRALLTDDFLAMPARLIRMADDISVLKSDVAELKVDMDGVKPDVAGLKTDMTSVKNDLGYLKGRYLERDLERLAHGRLASQLDLQGMRIIRGPRAGAMPEAFNNAITTDGLTEAQRGRILDADMILQATQRSTGRRVYAAVEASFTVNESDIDRARLTADILGQVFQDDLMVAAVYAIEISGQHQESANSANVLIFSPPR